MREVSELSRVLCDDEEAFEKRRLLVPIEVLDDDDRRAKDDWRAFI